MTSATDIITALGGVNNVSGELGLPYTTVDAWRYQNSIPKWRWPDVLSLAAKKGVSLSADQRPTRPRATDQSAAA